ncbi:MAG: hypothetical protein ACETWM_21595 [Candidatus Lokiarchaeia archaeon]
MKKTSKIDKEILDEAYQRGYDYLPRCYLLQRGYQLIPFGWIACFSIILG